MNIQHAPETIKAMGKNELIQLIINVSEENGIDWSTYGSLTRKKQADLVEIALEVTHAAGELTAEEPGDYDEAMAASAEGSFEEIVFDGDFVEMEQASADDWEYAEPNKPRWMKEAEAVEGLEDVEVNGIEDLEEFEDVGEIVASTVTGTTKTKKVKTPKEPKVKKEKAPKEPKERKARTFTAEQIHEIIELVEVAKWKKSKVAEKFECSGTMIHNIVVGNVYRDISGRGMKTQKAE